MENNFGNILELAAQTAKHLTEPSEWRRFLRTAGWNYKYPFHDQLLIYAQRPEATACAEIPVWNTLGRYARSESTGISLLDDNGSKPGLRYVFDVSDTAGEGALSLWELRAEHEDAVRFSLQAEPRVSLREALLQRVQELTQERLRDYLPEIMAHLDDSLLHGLEDQNTFVHCLNLVIPSVSVMVLTRCGYPIGEIVTTEDVQGIAQFTTMDSMVQLGTVVGELGEILLRQIERTVKKREQVLARTANVWHNENTEMRKGDGEDGSDLHEAGGLSPSGSEAGADRNYDRQVWAAAKELPHGAQEGSVLEPSPYRQAGSASGGDRPNSQRAHPSDHDGSGAGIPGSGQSDRSDGLDRLHEQPQASGGGNGVHGANLQLTNYDRETEDRSLPFFHASEQINAILRHAEYQGATKREMQDFFDVHVDDAERIPYVRGLFRTGVTELTIGGDGYGYRPYLNVLHLWTGSFAARTSQSFYHWGVIVDHLDSMMLLENFQTARDLPSEKEQMSLMNQAEAFKASAFSLPQQVIDAILRRGSSYEWGKQRIYVTFQSGIDRKELVSFLKKEYGTGGRYPALPGTDIDEWHESKGIKLTSIQHLGENGKLLLTWPTVQKRIGQLIALHRYLTPREKERIPEYLRWVEERRQNIAEQRIVQETENHHKDERRANARYSFSVGDSVFLGIEEYEVVAVSEAEVTMRDASFPLLMKTYPQSELEEILRENPLNDSLIDDSPEVPDIVTPISDPLPLPTKGESEKENAEPDVELPTLPVWQKPQQPSSSQSPIPSTVHNFRITDDHLGEGGAKTKYGWNVAAIRLLQRLENENRYAVSEEQEILHRFVGWGGLPQAFDDQNAPWSKEYAELKDLLSGEEYDSARASTLNAHYTSPVVIKAIYTALEGLGFHTGNVLEPACGVGNFLGLLPESMEGSKLYGVELDSITGRMAKQLYPHARIAVQGFEKAALQDSFFDLAVGNVPFGGYTLPDKRYDKHRFLIHDYFFAKSLDLVRPGGLIVFITSKGTMDKRNPEVRKYIAQRAELLGAIRLPNNAFLANAGTGVTSDILFLQKRDRPMQEEPAWIHLSQTEKGVTVNQYFAEHPEMLLGTMSYEDTQYGNEHDTACLPIPGADLATQLQEAMQHIEGHYQEAAQEHPEESEKGGEFLPADPDVRNFSFTVVNGAIYYRENSLMHPMSVSGAASERIKGMLILRDCVRDLILYQSEDYPDEAIGEKQAELNRLYDAYTAKYGLLTSRGNRLAFEDDSSYALLCSLEILDEDGNLERKADMFTKRTIRQHAPVTHVDTASEALAVSIAERACVDMGFMHSLSGISHEQLETDLEGVIFRELGDMEPESVPKAFYDLEKRPFVTADEYLSGNVRKKYRLARALAEMRPDLADRLQGNIQALEAVQPTDLTASEIEVHLGANWLPPEVVKDFVFELLDTPIIYQHGIDVLYSTHTGCWNVKGKHYDRSGNIRANVAFGTSRINAYEIVEDTLNLRDVRVFDRKTVDGKEQRILNSEETEYAIQKQEAIKDAFASWIWRDPERRDKLTTLYNERYNSIRPREYDGKHIRFVGMNPEITLREHQINAVARVLYGGNTLLAHCVGAGKTYEMIAAAMESKRLGLCSKSIFVVPNHLTEQWAGEFLQLYPSANILVTTKKDFDTTSRKRFCSRIATGDYDAVIIGHSQFEKIPISIERQTLLLKAQIREITDGIADLEAEQGERYSIKQLEKTKKALEARLERLNDRSRKDDVMNFEELGIDRLYVDEADFYKNLFLYTKMRNVAGISQTEAQKSTDLFMKCRYLDELTGGRGIVFATGTPISNSMTELYTMQRYLQYHILQEHDLLHFDCWAANFGETVTTIELAPEGTGYRAKTRFARFFNLPELMTMFKEVADIQTADMLHLPVPEAEYHNVPVKPSTWQQGMVKELAARADRVRKRKVQPDEDNMLKITNDGRKLALDQRLADPMLPDNPDSKVNACVRNILHFWREGMEERTTQLVFCDLSTPKAMELKMVDGVATMTDTPFTNVYEDLRSKLIDAGVPPNEIAFIHTANTEARKKELFAKVRKGQVRVLLGSTFKMGAGTNVQDRLIALHDLDCPWRPRDLEQRAGRIIRQGNRNPKVHLFRYVTENTFDAYLYQTVENKQKFISQIMTSKSPVRSAEDIDEASLSYAEVKALATGNPHIKEKMDMDIQVARLKLLKANHLSQRYALEDRVLKYYPQKEREMTTRKTALQEDVRSLEQHPMFMDKENTFPGMNVEGTVYRERGKAGFALIGACKAMKSPEEQEIGSYRGFALSLSYDSFAKKFELAFRGNLTYRVELGTDPLGNIARIQNLMEDLPDRVSMIERELENLSRQREEAMKQLEVPFDKEAELAEKLERLTALNALLSVEGDVNRKEEAEEIEI